MCCNLLGVISQSVGSGDFLNITCLYLRGQKVKKG